MSVRLAPVFWISLAVGSWDLLCQHAARTGDYRNPDFDVPAALAENTHNLSEYREDDVRRVGLRASC